MNQSQRWVIVILTMSKFYSRSLWLSLPQHIAWKLNYFLLEVGKWWCYQEFFSILWFESHIVWGLPSFISIYHVLLFELKINTPNKKEHIKSGTVSAKGLKNTHWNSKLRSNFFIRLDHHFSWGNTCTGLMCERPWKREKSEKVTLQFTIFRLYLAKLILKRLWLGGSWGFPG